MTTPQDRAAFEAAYIAAYPVTCSLNLDKFDIEDGEYKHSVVQVAYVMWQAALQSQAATVKDSLTDQAEPVPPFGSIRKAAMAIYKPPFKYEHGYIFDADHHMVADDGSLNDDEPSVGNAIAARIRGWGRIGYKPNAAKLQDEVGAMVADALTAYYTTPPATQAALSKALGALKELSHAVYEVHHARTNSRWFTGGERAAMQHEITWVTKASEIANSKAAPAIKELEGMGVRCD